ncbi:MAG: protein translocase subunit SecD [Acidobacteriota bacterium]
MERTLLVRGIIILIVVVGFAIAVYPPGETINLGLDLQGGMHLVLRVNTDDALRTETEFDVDRMVEELADLGIEGVRSERLTDTRYALVGLSSDDYPTFDKEVWDRFFSQTWDIASRSGDRVEVTLESGQASQLRDQAVTQALETIRNRVDEFGVAEPVIVREGLGSERIVVQLPGVDDPERVKDLIKNTAFLEFRLVAPAHQGSYPNRESAVAALGGVVPSEYEIFPEQIRNDVGQVTDEIWWIVESKRVVTGRDLRNASPSSGQFGEPVVSFTFNLEGGRKFGEATGANIGRKLAIVLDGKIRSAPNINGRITTDGIIQGDFNQQEVTDLAMVLRTGALPASIVYLEERTVGPTLGQDSIERGELAGVIGGIFVILAMLIVYRLTGVNAVVVLALNIVLVFGALALFGATLTLPGIAGIVLTVGMAVDANVLIFERIREELRAGRTVKAAIDTGFDKALSSILDANFTTLIAAAFLFLFGTGPIRGFAVTLSVGIVASLFTAVIVSRFLFDVQLAGKRRVEKLSI